MAPKRVLVIDDSLFIRKVVMRILGDEFAVEASGDAAASLEQIVKGESYDVIVLDLAMPHLTGVDFFAALRAQSPSHLDRVVLVTAGPMTDADAELLKTIPNPVLTKPFTNAILKEVVRKVAHGIT